MPPIRKQRTRWSRVARSKPDAAIPEPELAAWTMVANEMLNLDETLNKVAEGPDEATSALHRLRTRNSTSRICPFPTA